MIVILFIIALLHGLIFAQAQQVERFVSPEMASFLTPYNGILIIVLYFSGVAAALSSQWASRIMGIKNVFIAGLISNFVGIACFYATDLFVPGSAASIIVLAIGLFSLGVAISWVATVLATYVIIRFPKRVALGLIVLYSCLDFGFMISEPLFQFFEGLGDKSFYLLGLILVMGGFIYLVKVRLADPEIPRHLENLRKGSVLWKELKYRLVLFFFAMVLYGVLESMFSFFGHEEVSKVLNIGSADQILFVFWLTLALMQIAIGVPAFWVSPGKVLAVLPLFVLVALVLGMYQTDYSGYLMAFIIGGIGCSAIFPLLIAMVGIELKQIEDNKHTVEILPYFESAVGYLVGAYTLGLGIIALIEELQYRMSAEIFRIDFRTGIACAIALLIIVIFLDKSQPLRKKQ